jgi:formylglycine-generating enzyme required for sulfatase activity
MWEWTFDQHASFSNPCDDCANLTASDPLWDGFHVRRGGFWGSEYFLFSSALRSMSPPDVNLNHLGARCVRSGS